MAVRRDSQLGGLTNRADAEAQHWPAPDLERQARIVSVCNQLAAQRQYRRSSAYGQPSRRAPVGAEQLRANLSSCCAVR
jgi:hypothetical protein